MAVNEEILLDIKVQNSDALANIAKLSSANKELKNSLAELTKENKAGKLADDEYAKSKALITAQLKENNAGIRENSKEIKTNAASVASASDSINGMRARVDDLTNAWNGLSADARKGDAGKAIGAELKSLNENINTANKSVSKFKDNVGNYPDVVNAVGGSNTVAGKTFETLGIVAQNGLGGIGKALSSLVAPFKAVIVQMWAMVTNPIGAILLAIAAAVGALYLVFKDFKPLVDKVEQSLAALGAIFSVLKNTVIALFTGQKSLSESTKGLGDSMAKAAKQAAELKKAQQELEDGQDALDVKNKRDETQIQKLMLQSKNRTLSEQERIRLLDEAQKKSEDIFKRNKAQNDEEVRIAENKIIVGKNLTDKEIARLRREGVEYARQLQDKKQISDEEIKALTSALLKREDINQQYIGLQEKAQNKIDALAEKAEADREKADEKNKAAREKRLQQIEKQQEKEIKSAENLLSLMKTNQKDLDETLLIDPKYFQQRIELLTQNVEQERKINSLKLKYNKISNDEYLIQELNINKEIESGKLELSQKLANQTIKNLEFELQYNKLKNESLIVGEQLTNEQIHQNKINEIDKTNSDEIEKLKIQRDAKIIDETEYQNQVVLKNAEKNLKIAQENEDFDKSEAERRLQAQSDNYANELSLLQSNSDRAIEIKKAELDARMMVEIESAKKIGASTTLIEQKYANEKKRIDKEVNDAKIDQAKRIVDGVSSLFGKATKAGKAAASASVAIDTYKGAQAAIAGMAGAGPVGWALGAVEAGVIIAGGIKSIADIWKVSEDSATSISGSASSPASGTSGSMPSTVYTNLPTLGGLYSSNANQAETQQIIAQSQPSPVVRVTEITEMQNSVSVKENSKL